MKIIGLFILKCDGEQPIFLSTSYDLSFVRLDIYINFNQLLNKAGIKDYL